MSRKATGQYRVTVTEQHSFNPGRFAETPSAGHSIAADDQAEGGSDGCG